MTKTLPAFAPFALLAGGALALAACGSTDDASTEAMPDTVEVPADDALELVTEEPVEDSEALGPPPAPVAPDQQTTEEAADAAADVAADADAALQALDAAEAADPPQ